MQSIWTVLVSQNFIWMLELDKELDKYQLTNYMKRKNQKLNQRWPQFSKSVLQYH